MRPLRDRSRDGVADEELLPRDPPQVAGGVGAVDAVEHVLEVPRPGEGEGARPVEGDTTGVQHVQPGVLVLHGPLEVQGDPVDRRDHLLEPREVDLHVVVHGDAQELLDGVRQHLLPLGVGGVDALRAVLTGDRHPQVPGQRQHGRRLLRGVDPDDQDRVGPPTGRLSVEEGAGVGVLPGDVLPAVRSHDQEVRGLTGGDIGQVDVVGLDLTEPPDAVRDPDRGAGEADDEHDTQREQQPLGPGATGSRGVAALRNHAAFTLPGVPARDRATPPGQDVGGFGSRGRPRTRSPTMFRWISAVPPQIVSDREKKNADIIWLTG